ncbi:MAG: membrane protein [Thermodesulfobacteriota bacterium]|nr:MAG: membrane protein [Thermodesulfobacteriota bacterium]
MSDLSQFEEVLRQWSFLSIPVAVLVASILGSTHCITMCGPIAITVNNSSGYMSLYHIGRLISYLILGTLAGLLGEAFLSNNFPLISTISIGLISIFFIYTGYKLVVGKPLEFLPSKTISSLISKPAKWSLSQSKPIKSLTLGIVNGFLPCGWVYIFVIGAVATKNPVYSAGILFIFWLGTVPALSAFPYIYKKTFKKAPRKLAIAAGVLLIIVGLANITIHLLPNNNNHNHHVHNTEH